MSNPVKPPKANISSANKQSIDNQPLNASDSTETLSKDNFPSTNTSTPFFSFITWKVFITIAVIVFFLKLIIAAKTIGSTDVYGINSYAVIAQTIGGADLYKKVSYYNHPPFIIHLLNILKNLESLTGIGFPFLLRFLSSVADLGILVLIYKLSKLNTSIKIPFPYLLLMVFAPVSILVAGFHGNTDPVLIFFLILSIYLIEVDKEVFYSWLPLKIKEKFIEFNLTNLCLAGVAYGFSTNIKVIAFIAAPCIFFYLSNNKKRLEYTISAAITWIILSTPYIFQVPEYIIKNSFSYNSFYGSWGVSRILSSTLPSNHWLNNFYSSQSKFLIIFLIITMSLFMNFIGKKIPIFIQVGFTFFIFLGLSPGFGIQYLFWLLPWVLALGLEAALIYYVTSGIYAVMVYNFWSGGFPWNFASADAKPYHNFILNYEYICWGSVILISFYYIVYIIKYKYDSIKKVFTNNWVTQSHLPVVLVLLFLTTFMAYKDLFINKGFYTYTVDGENYETREKQVLEATLINISRFYSLAGLNKESIDTCNEILKMNPKSADAYNNICVAYASMKEWEKAVEAGKKAVEINPNYQLAQNNLNWVKSQLAATGKISSEPADIVSYLKTPPANFTAGNFINMSLELIQKADNCNAVIACEKAIELEPNNSIAYNNMCIAYNNLLMFDEAESACKKATELNPQFELAKNNYNFTLSRKSNPTAPKATAEAFISLSLAFYNVGKFDRSIPLAKKALELQPNSSIVYNNLCVSYIGANKIDEAISAGEMAVKLDPNSSLAKANLDWAKSLKK